MVHLPQLLLGKLFNFVTFVISKCWFGFGCFLQTRRRQESKRIPPSQQTDAWSMATTTTTTTHYSLFTLLYLDTITICWLDGGGNSCYWDGNIEHLKKNWKVLRSGESKDLKISGLTAVALQFFVSSLPLSPYFLSLPRSLFLAHSEAAVR